MAARQEAQAEELQLVLAIVDRWQAEIEQLAAQSSLPPEALRHRMLAQIQLLREARTRLAKLAEPAQQRGAQRR